MNVWSDFGSPPIAPVGDDAFHYVLVDAAQVNRFSVRLKGTARVNADEPLFGRPIAPNNADATPHLLALTGPVEIESLMRQWADYLTSHGALTWLVSPLSHAELTRRLRSRLDARLDANFDCVNRFFDGRVTPHLHECLNAAQRESFFSIATQWWVVDHTQQWLSLPCSFTAQDVFVPPLLLNDRQQAHLIDACYPYTVIEHFLQTDEVLLDRLPAPKRYAFFRDALKVAAEYGIDGGATAILFCTLTLTRGAAFYDQAEWQTVLGQVKRAEITLQHAVKMHSN